MAPFPWQIDRNRLPVFSTLSHKLHTTPLPGMHVAVGITRTKGLASLCNLIMQPHVARCHRTFERSLGVFLWLLWCHSAHASGGVGDAGTLNPRVTGEGETSQNQVTTGILCDCWRSISPVKTFEDMVTWCTRIRKPGDHHDPVPR